MRGSVVVGFVVVGFLFSGSALGDCGCNAAAAPCEAATLQTAVSRDPAVSGFGASLPEIEEFQPVGAMSFEIQSSSHDGEPGAMAVMALVLLLILGGLRRLFGDDRLIVLRLGEMYAASSPTTEPADYPASSSVERIDSARQPRTLAPPNVSLHPALPFESQRCTLATVVRP